MHGRTDNVKTVYPLQTKFAGGIKNNLLFFPMNILMCTPIDTRGIFALLWWYKLAYRNIHIRWFNENLFHKPHSSSLWHTHAHIHAIVKVYMGHRPCRIESRQIQGLSMKPACTCSTFHFNSSTLFAYEVICHGFVVCWYFFFQNQFFLLLFFSIFFFGNISKVSSSLDPDHAHQSKLFAKVISRRH